MLTILVLAAGTALAAPTPTAADPLRITCAPARAAARIGRMVPAGVLPGDADRGDPLKAAIGTMFRDPEAARGMGLDPDGPLDLALGGGEMRIALPHETAGPGALADHLGLEPGPGGDLASPGEGPVIAAGGQLVLGSLSLAEIHPALVASFPTGAGCRIHMPVPDQGLRLGAWIPADPTVPVELRVQGPTPPPAVLSAPPAPPIGGSSHARPFVVASLGVSPLALLEDPTVRAALEKANGETPDPSALDGIVRILPGATLAVFMAGEGPKGVVALPIAGPRGGPARVGRLTRLLSRGIAGTGAQVSRLGRGALRVETRKDTLTLVVQPDRLLVGNHTDATLQAAAGRGDPWVGPALDGLAREQPIAAVMDTGAMFPGMGAVVLEAAVGATAEAWTLKLGLDGDPDLVRMIAEGIGRSVLDRKTDGEPSTPEAAPVSP